MKKVLLLIFLTSVFWSNVSYSYFSYHAVVTNGDMQFEGRRANNFTESQIGLRYSFNPTFSVEVSGIARFVENDNDYYGGQLLTPVTSNVFSFLSLQAYLAPGMRVLRGYWAPVIEGGITAGFNSLRFGVGARQIFNQAFSNGLEDESQLFFVVGFRAF